VDGQTVDLSGERAVAALFTKLGAFDHLIFTAGDNLHLYALADTDLKQARHAFELRTRGFDRFEIAHSSVESASWKCRMVFRQEIAMRKRATQPASGSIVIPKNDQNRSIKSQSRGRPRSEESEEAIVAATLRLLVAKPLRDISMEEIARIAGVGKATIYKWWPSKAYVALDAFLRKANQMMPMPDTGSVRRDFLEQVRSLMVFYNGPAGPILGQFVAEAQSDKEFAALYRERFLKPRREATGVIFDRGVKRGEIDQNLDRELVLDLIYAPAVYRLMVGHAPLDRKVADGIVSILFDGLDSRPSKIAVIGRRTARKCGSAGKKAK
jgi:AcrR family transcriptional regulator